MKCRAPLALALSLGFLANGAVLRGSQPYYTDSQDPMNKDKDFAISAQASKDDRMPGYRNAWDDCGGVGASATERMRMIAAKIKGWAKPLPFVRNAAQDCSPPAAGPVDPSGTVPGPGARVNFPGPEIPAAAREGLKTAADTLEKYPAEVKPKAEYVVLPFLLIQANTRAKAKRAE